MDINFNKDIASILCQINMSSYNLFGGFDPRLPDNLKYLTNINNTGYIYELKGWSKQIIIFSFRGTKTGDDVITDLDSVQTEMVGYPKNVLTHRGFYRLWLPCKDSIKKFVKDKCTKESIFLITGHSLGCASALLSALMISGNNPNVKFYMFAPPRIGNHHLINLLDKEVPSNYAVINTPDIIPNLPPVTFTTIGSTWLYENFTNRYVLDYQLGSIMLNHRLDTYYCGLNEKSELCREPIWKKIPVMVTS